MGRYKMKHKAKLTISRPSYGDGRKKITIRVEDDDAVIRFLDIEMDLADFAECITGLSYVNCEMEVRGLENVGKKRESMPIIFEMTAVDYDVKVDTAIKLAEEAAPEGWVCSSYFGSQDSFFYKDGKYYGRTTAYRWVEK